MIPLDPELANRNVRYSFTVNYVDLQADVFNGTCELSTSVGTVSGPVNQLLPGGDPNATSGSVVCVVSVQVATPMQITGNITVIDRAGHRSNSLSFVLGIHETPLGTTPGAGTGRPTIEMESGTLRP